MIFFSTIDSLDPLAGLERLICFDAPVTIKASALYQSVVESWALVKISLIEIGDTFTINVGI